MPEEPDVDEAEDSADETIERACRAAAREHQSRGGIGEDYGGVPPEQVPEEIDQPPRQ
jgi:hypothetical protein